jgi:hypothetical protein
MLMAAVATDDAALDLIFRKARTHGAWRDEPVADALLAQVYDLAKSNFLCNLGHGDASKLKPRSPRLDFEEACRIE